MYDGLSLEPKTAALNRGYGALFALMAVACMVGLAACAPQEAMVSPEQRLAMIPTGEPLLTCRAECLAAWQAAAPQAEAFARAGQWTDLALLVLRIDYEDDLTTYYLGEAAQGMGYPTAAENYYRQSVELSSGPAACAVYSRMCGGVSLPRAALASLAALRLPVRRPHPPVTRPAPKAAEPSAAPAAPQVEAPPAQAPAPQTEALPSAPAGPQGEAPPSPTATPQVQAPPPSTPALPVGTPAAPPASPARAPSQEEQQFIEPPPAHP
jgi:hypothetical protein